MWLDGAAGGPRRDRASVPAQGQDLDVRGEVPEAQREQLDLPVEEPRELVEPDIRRFRLEQGLAADVLDLDDPGEQIRQRGRIVGDRQAAGGVLELGGARVGVGRIGVRPGSAVGSAGSGAPAGASISIWTSMSSASSPSAGWRSSR